MDATVEAAVGAGDDVFSATTSARRRECEERKRGRKPFCVCVFVKPITFLGLPGDEV
jgi:hypothetical protein